MKNLEALILIVIVVAGTIFAYRDIREHRYQVWYWFPCVLLLALAHRGFFVGLGMAFVYAFSLGAYYRARRKA